MKPLVLMGAMAALPFLLALIFRVSSVFVLVSILSGDLLVKFLSDDATLALSAVTKTQYVSVIAQIFLLTLPLIMTLIILRKSLARSRVVLHILPLAANGLLFMVLLLPLLPAPTQGEILHNPITKQVQSFQDLIVGASVLLTLFVMWISYKPHEPHHKGKHHR
jgi:hypothetical protein